MRHFLFAKNRLCMIVPAVTMLVASPVERSYAAKPTDQVEAASGYEEAPEAAEPPSGYEEAPQAGDPKPKADRKSNNLSGFEAAAAILDGKAPNANVANMERAYLSQCKQLVNAERSFLLRACRLDEQQKSRIAEVTDQCARIAARRYAIAQSGGMRNGMIWGGGFMPANGPVMVVAGGGAGNPNFGEILKDPRKEVGRLLLLAVDDLLSPQQKQRYTDESKKRQDHFRRTTVLNLVALIDGRLVLTDRQREQFIDVLTKNWDPSWSGAVNNLIHSHEDYLPRIQDKHVLKLLDDKQKVLWQGIQKVGFGHYGTFSIGNSPSPIDDKFAVLKKVEEKTHQSPPTN